MSMRSNEIHVFDNGIKVFKSHLIDAQIARYKVQNLHEPEEEAIMNSILDAMPGDQGVFVDVGAAIGYYLFLVAMKKPKFRMYAFEPLRVHRGFLKENMSLNSVNKENLILCPEALYDKIGSVFFKKQLFGSKVIKGHGGLFSFLGNYRVKSVTLDNFMRREQLSFIDIIKIDVQGGEINVLKGGAETFLKKQVKCAIVGTHSRQKHEAVKKYFQTMGYDIAVDVPETVTQPDGIVVAKC